MLYTIKIIRYDTLKPKNNQKFHTVITIIFLTNLDIIIIGGLHHTKVILTRASKV